MSLNISCYKIVGRKHLGELYDCLFKMFKKCCGICWCCIRRKKILDEFNKKGFKTFNSNKNGWKSIDDLNTFEITPLG